MTVGPPATPSSCGGGNFSATSSSAVSSSHEFSTISRTRRLYSRRFSEYSRDASELAGEAGFGSDSSDWIEVRIAEMS